MPRPRMRPFSAVMMTHVETDTEVAPVLIRVGLEADPPGRVAKQTHRAEKA